MNTSAVVPHLESQGVRLAPRPEAPELSTPLTFGDVPAEYEAAREGIALFDASDRGQLTITGADARAFLHRLLANDVHGLEPGLGNRNLLLSSKGKIQHDFDLACEPDGFSAVTVPGGAEALRAALDMYLFTDDVTLEDTGDRTAPLELCGPLVRAVASALLGPVPEPASAGGHAWTLGEFDGVPVRMTALPILGTPGLRVDAGPEHAAALWDALVGAGATPAGLVVRDILRVEDGAALWGVDVSDEVYPQEARLEEAFSLDKGCYIGQEVVAKIDTYGGLNKRLVALRVDHDDPVPPGTRLVREEKGEERDLGVTTSWAYSFALDTGCVLAYAKRRHQEPGTVFRLGDSGATGTVVDLPIRP